MKRSLWFLALIALVVLPVLAEEPPQPAATPQAASKTPAAPKALNGPYDLYGTFWFPGVAEAEWSPFLIPTGPPNFWDAYTWGFVRFRYWFDAERYGWGWPPNFSPLGWGYDGWYGGWYGWLPDGTPAGMGMGSSWGFYSQVVQPFRVQPVRPAEAIAPRPLVTAKPQKQKGWFHGALRPARSDEGMSTNRDDWSRGALSSGGSDSKSNAHGTNPPMGMRPSPPPSSRPPVRRR